MQQFVFCDKSKPEMEIITDVLYSENIRYKIKSFLVKEFIFDEAEDEDNDDEFEDFVIIEEMYNIICFTDLEHFDFVKHLANKKIKDRLNLERCYFKKAAKGKNVSRISKKNTTNTNKGNKSKRKG